MRVQSVAVRFGKLSSTRGLDSVLWRATVSVSESNRFDEALADVDALNDGWVTTGWWAALERVGIGRLRYLAEFFEESDALDGDAYLASELARRDDFSDPWNTVVEDTRRLPSTGSVNDVRRGPVALLDDDDTERTVVLDVKPIWFDAPRKMRRRWLRSSRTSQRDSTSSFDVHRRRAHGSVPGTLMTLRT